MAVSSIDYENVDMRLLSAIQTLKAIEQQITGANFPSIKGTDVFVIAIDAYRNEIAMEIERQGAR